jgi:hypothetical protein
VLAGIYTCTICPLLLIFLGAGDCRSSAYAAPSSPLSFSSHSFIAFATNPLGDHTHRALSKTCQGVAISPCRRRKGRLLAVPEGRADGVGSWDSLGNLRNNGNSGEFLDETLSAIHRISNDKTLSEVQRIQMIRDIMPPPVYPQETEPGLRGETLVAKSFGHLNDLLFLDSCEPSHRKGPLDGGRHKPIKLYRGMPDSDMQLLTSLQRLLGESDSGSMRISPNAARRLEEGMVLISY